MSRLIGLDIGEVRTGIAVSDELRLTARPLRTVSTSELLPELRQLTEEYAVDTVVVGRPRHLDGGLGTQAASVDATVDSLRGRLPVTFVYEDETGTTAASDGTDEGAACVILQGYLDSQARD